MVGTMCLVMGADGHNTHTYAECHSKATVSTFMAQMHVVSHQAAQHHDVAASEAGRGAIRPEATLHEAVFWISMHSYNNCKAH